MKKYFCDMCGKEMEFDARVELDFHSHQPNRMDEYREVCRDCCKKLLTMTTPKDGGK